METSTNVHYFENSRIYGYIDGQSLYNNIEKEFPGVMEHMKSSWCRQPGMKNEARCQQLSQMLIKYLSLKYPTTTNVNSLKSNVSWVGGKIDEKITIKVDKKMDIKTVYNELKRIFKQAL